MYCRFATIACQFPIRQASPSSGRGGIGHVAQIRVRFRQTPFIDRAKLLLDAYQPVSGPVTPARRLKAIRVAKTLAKELEPQKLVPRLNS